MKKAPDKAPKWFREWLQNDYWHLNVKVNITMWVMLATAAAIIAEVVRRYVFL